MMRELLRQQWKTSASAVLVLSLVAFTIPLLTVFYGGGLTEADASNVAAWLGAAVNIGRAFPVLALFSGVLLAMAAWGPVPEEYRASVAETAYRYLRESGLAPDSFIASQVVVQMWSTDTTALMQEAEMAGRQPLRLIWVNDRHPGRLRDGRN
jgi:hypothetical protein